MPPKEVPRRRIHQADAAPPRHLQRRSGVQAGEDEVTLWARAGFSWIVNDGEHQGLECRYGLAENAALQRAAQPILSTATLKSPGSRVRAARRRAEGRGPRCGLSDLGRRAPRSTTPRYTVPEPADKAREGKTRGLRRPTRGAYPMRRGDRRSTFDPQSLRAAETETPRWLQFETGELLLDVGAAGRAPLDVMAAKGEAGRAASWVPSTPSCATGPRRGWRRRSDDDDCSRPRRRAGWPSGASWAAALRRIRATSRTPWCARSSRARV